MRLAIKRYNSLFQIVLAIVLFAIGFIISGFANDEAIKKYFPYGSCLVFTVITWFLFKIEDKSLTVIGFDFRKKHLKFLIFGVVLGLLIWLVTRVLQATLLGEELKLSNLPDVPGLFLAFYFILPQVITEELLFRGYLFKKIISISNVVIANSIISIIFTLVHVLDEDVLQNRAMIFMLISTIPIGHVLFATALLKSKTLWFPIGLHLGHNWATRHLIGISNNETSIFYVEQVYTFESWSPFILSLLIYNCCFVMLTLVIWKWNELRRLFKSIRMLKPH